MGFKIKNSLTGEFEKLPILTLKGEKGETGGVEEYNKVDYMGNKYETLKQANDANVEYAVKTAIGEFNYLDYDGQHITATDTIEGQSKSAILSGNTLVNLNKMVYPVTSWGANVGNNNYYRDDYTLASGMIKPSTKYLFKVYGLSNIHEVRLQGTNATTFVDASGKYRFDSEGNLVLTSTGNIHEYTQFIPHFKRDTVNNLTTEEMNSFKMIILEYQDGMENWDIPYFEGMQSVKMPVLTTTGKNLFDGKLELGGYAGTTGKPYNANDRVRSINKTYLKPGVYYLSSDNATAISFCIFNIDGTFRQEHANTSGNKLKLVLEQEAYAHITVINPDLLNAKIQLEKGSTATPYEPYKSNILTTPEDLELRGIGNVKDELSVATGELTQRVGEIVLDGSDDENWKRDSLTIDGKGNLLRFRVNNYINDAASNENGICDKVISRPHTDMPNEEYIRIGPSPMYYVKDLSMTLEQFKEKLSKDPITVQYQLATPVIKTVDLSDNHVYSYDNITHYDCSSAEDSLVPTLSVKVPTDVQATIAQQRETIQTLNSENERLNQIQEALKASMLDSQVQLMNISWNTDFEVFTLRESIAPKDFLLDSRTGSNIDKFSQAKFIIENDCPDLEKLNSQIEYYFSKDVFSQEQFEELTDLISIVKGGNGCEY